MKTVTVAETEADFSALLKVVEAGEEIEVMRRKKTIARIITKASLPRL